MTDSESHQSQGEPVKYFSVVMYLLRERQKFLEEIREGVKLKSKIFGLLDLLQKKYVLSLKLCSSLGQTLNYWVDWHLLKLAQPARL